MKTILFLENGVSSGGSFESLFLLITHLDRTKFRPVVVFVNTTAYIERLKAHGIVVELIHDVLYSRLGRGIGKRIFVRILLLLKRLIPTHVILWERILHHDAIRALRGLMQTHHVDLVHLNNQSIRDLYGVIATVQMKVPCLSYLRSARVTSVPFVVSRFLNRNVAQFIANSRFAKEYWEGLGVDLNKIHVVYNAIDDATHSSLHVRKEWDIDASVKYVMGCVGNLSEGKGQDFLIRAFKKVLEQEPQTVLLIVGDGPCKVKCKELAEELGISHAVIFTGYDARAREIIAGVDLFVLPSQTETFGRVLLEAMIVGTPIIATRVGGIPEVVEHEKSGLLVDFGDEEGFATAMCMMLHNEPLRSHCVQGGLRRVQADFGLSVHVHTLERIYDSL